MKKLPFALSLLAAATFCLAACDDDDDEVPVQVPTTVTATTTSPVPKPCVSVMTSASASPSASVSVSVSPSDKVKNDVPGDGGVVYRPGARKAMRPAPEPDATTPTPVC